MTLLLNPKLFLLVLAAILAVADSDVLLRRDCGKRYHLDNGYVDFSKADTTLEAPVTCNPGYKPAKAGKIYCGSDGKWIDETCVIKDCKTEKTVKNGIIVYGNKTTYNELAEVVCDKGYKVKGHPYLVCQTDGKWTDNTTCETVDCGMDYKIDHGYVEFKGGKTIYNKKYNVTCEKGYRVAGDKQTTCLADGEWSKHTACLPVDCGTEIDLENGYADFQDVETTYKQKLPVYCMAGYFRQGNDYLICDENGTWSWPESVKCHLVHCKTNHSIAHSSANFTARSSFSYGEVVPVHCDPGYELVGGPFATCLGNGEWSDTRCESKDCGKVHEIEFGTVIFDDRWTTYRSKAAVKCNKGFRVNGEESVTCLASGKWSTLTTCVMHACETVYSLENGYVDFFEADVSYKKKVNVSCNAGFYIDGSEQVECLEDGKWSKTKCSNNFIRESSLLIIAGCVAGILLGAIVIAITITLKRRQMLCFVKRFKL